jgi:hypothetical protein
MNAGAIPVELGDRARWGPAGSRSARRGRQRFLCDRTARRDCRPRPFFDERYVDVPGLPVDDVALGVRGDGIQY